MMCLQPPCAILISKVESILFPGRSWQTCLSTIGTGVSWSMLHILFALWGSISRSFTSRNCRISSNSHPAIKPLCSLCWTTTKMTECMRFRAYPWMRMMMSKGDPKPKYTSKSNKDKKKGSTKRFCGWSDDSDFSFNLNIWSCFFTFMLPFCRVGAV